MNNIKIAKELVKIAGGLTKVAGDDDYTQKALKVCEKITNDLNKNRWKNIIDLANELVDIARTQEFAG